MPSADPSYPAPPSTPDFLVIGAMKAGSTSFFVDLNAQPGIYVPEDKELGVLYHHADPADAARAYAEEFAKAPADKKLGDCTTGYSKLPETAGLAERARAVCGRDCKIIYIVRHPIDRLLSHYHHMYSKGMEWTLAESLDFAMSGGDGQVTTMTGLVDYSCYAMQLVPWREAFGADHVMVIQFERYVKNRSAVLREACDFLGVEMRVEPDASKAMNASDGKPKVINRFGQVRDSRLYRSVVRPVMPDGMKQWLMHKLIPTAPPRLRKMDRANFERVRECFEEDQRQLAAMCGWDGPPWDLERFVDDASPAPESASA
ncbi:MAG: sulfotransferase domain-containing protein [Planctomycetota bacterium]